jgi:multiple sugar transport system substrate-binding protein
VIQSERSWYSSFVSTGYSSPLDDLMGSAYMDDMYPAIKDDLAYKGDTYAVPWFYSPFVMFYNKDIFEQAGLDPLDPPSTYEEALDAARAIGDLTDSDGNSVYGLGITSGSVPVSGGSLLSMFFSFGGSIVDDKEQVAADNPGNRAALAYLQTLAQEHLNPEGAKLKDLRNLFAIGRLGMYFDTLWGINGAASINPAIMDSVAVRSPLSSSMGTAGSTLEAHLLMVSEDSAHKQAAADFLKLATSPEEIEKYYAVSTFLMAFKSQAALDSYADDEFVKDVLQAVDSVRPVPKDPNMENAYLEITSAVQSVTLGTTSPEAAAAQLHAKLKELL